MTPPSGPTQHDSLLGDPLPSAVADYYAAIDDPRVDDAAAACSDDVLYAVAAPNVIETDARWETEGQDALRDRFEQRGVQPWAHDILLCAMEGSSCLVEGVLRRTDRSEVWASFAASMQLDGIGLVRRYLAYLCIPAVELTPAGAAPSNGAAAGDAAAALDRYFGALDAGAFADAAACFSEDVLYSHPPYRHTGIDGNERVSFRGRSELLRAFEARGRQSFDHRILASIQRGPHCLLEGIVEGLPEGGTGSFVSSLTLDGDGLIRRYVSFYCEPSVRRWSA
jgi:ketosteroid isomerase-like protein